MSDNNEEMTNPALEAPVEKDTPIKEWLVDYVGNKFQESYDEYERTLAAENNEEPWEWDGSITVDMIVEAVAQEFPDFLLAVAEENWIRGYHQALTDVETGQQIYEEEKKKIVDDPNED